MLNIRDAEFRRQVAASHQPFPPDKILIFTFTLLSPSSGFPLEKLLAVQLVKKFARILQKT